MIDVVGVVNSIAIAVVVVAVGLVSGMGVALWRLFAFLALRGVSYAQAFPDGTRAALRHGHRVLVARRLRRR